MVEAIVRQNSDSVMSGMFECVNHSSVAESDFVMCGDNSNPDSVMSDVVPCSNDFSVAESDFLICHRSGNFMSESKGLRHLKILGSNKINAYCPAALKVTEHTDGKCIVSYQKVHVGHQKDLGHLFLTADERKNIASKIAAKIPLDNILDEIRNSISDAGLERVHLLTKKDLHNIEKSFNLFSNSVKHENDGVSVDMWVREMQNSENPCILFYKTQGSTCTQYSFLKENDFVLIIMTEAQGEILKKFNSDCICMDGTWGNWIWI
ncbi:uncharacterized protein NPIL_228381 [Nephila pilipes]|uniref:Uncharacterized protein n=1 Tax=Nephila pilipes TaxID=299642 RepID=A0A8X6P203_NEPPI|nr:uncharacterized protein NPIL_107941 [Nephila pilipes]GFT42863.1 uncharacterized protein NPIL_228381 [Nephila pilipes]